MAPQERQQASVSHDKNPTLSDNIFTQTTEIDPGGHIRVWAKVQPQATTRYIREFGDGNYVPYIAFLSREPSAMHQTRLGALTLADQSLKLNRIVHPPLGSMFNISSPADILRKPATPPSPFDPLRFKEDLLRYSQGEIKQFPIKSIVFVRHLGVTVEKYESDFKALLTRTNDILAAVDNYAPKFPDLPISFTWSVRY